MKRFYALRLLTRLIRREEGSATILSLYFLLIALVMGGLAIDFNKLQADHTRLQVAADAAAHAALYNRDTKTEEEAKAAAVLVAQEMLPEWSQGHPIEAADITFGRWDRDTLTFTADAGSRTAVQVDATRTLERGNAVRNILLSMVGFQNFDVVRRSTFATYRPTCFREGFVAENIVDIQSNNSFTNGFCIHSNTYVSLNSNNYFEPGTIVSMPDENDIDLPRSGFTTNDGLRAALREGSYRMRILNKLPSMISSLISGQAKYRPSYITVAGVTTLSSRRDIAVTDLMPGRTYYVTCRNNQLDIGVGVYSRVVVFANCPLRVSNGVVFQDAIVGTTSTDIRSVTSPSGFQLGKDDNCAPGGGAVLMTLGGVNVASDLRLFNAQILALKDVEFAANANGIKGASIVTMGQISGTSNMNMGFCNNDGMEAVFQAEYFRAVE